MPRTCICGVHRLESVRHSEITRPVADGAIPTPPFVLSTINTSPSTDVPWGWSHVILAGDNRNLGILKIFMIQVPALLQVYEANAGTIATCEPPGVPSVDTIGAAS